jgi:hypothetical protein
VTTQPEGGVVITLADIYRQVVALAARVDSALARQDRADAILSEHETELRPLAGADRQIADHEARLRVIERSRWPLTSVTVLIAVASLVLAAISLYARKAP